jgi:hypothetical protein
MSDRDVLLSVIQKLFEHDVETAANILEGMTEDEAAEIFRTAGMKNRRVVFFSHTEGR